MHFSSLLTVALFSGSILAAPAPEPQSNVKNNLASLHGYPLSSSSNAKRAAAAATDPKDNLASILETLKQAGFSSDYTNALGDVLAVSASGGIARRNAGEETLAETEVLVDVRDEGLRERAVNTEEEFAGLLKGFLEKVKSKTHEEVPDALEGELAASSGR